jgi:hypothetical protein
LDRVEIQNTGAKNHAQAKNDPQRGAGSNLPDNPDYARLAEDMGAKAPGQFRMTRCNF